MSRVPEDKIVSEIESAREALTVAIKRNDQEADGMSKSILGTLQAA